MKKLFLVTEKAPDFFLRALSNEGFEVIYSPGITFENLKNIIPSISAILIRSNIILDENLLKLADKLEMVFRPGSGLDIIDLEMAKLKNITIFNSPEGNRDAVGEHTMGLLLSLLNHIPDSYDQIKNGEWNRKKNMGIEIKGKTTAIIGFGNMGTAFATRLSSFQTNILVYDKYKSNFSFPGITETNMEQIFRDADIISFHIPLSEETKMLVNKTFFQQFRKPVFLINTSRGKILDTAALLWAIENKVITGAALDVLENENLSLYTDNERDLLDKLAATGRVIITPHVAGLTVESEDNIFQILISKLQNYNDFRTN